MAYDQQGYWTEEGTGTIPISLNKFIVPKEKKRLAKVEKKEPFREPAQAAIQRRIGSVPEPTDNWVDLTIDDQGQDQGFDLGGLIGGVGKFLADTPISMRRTGPGGWSASSAPLIQHRKQQAKDAQDAEDRELAQKTLTPKQYDPDKGLTLGRPEGGIDPRTGKPIGKLQTWSFNKNASGYARKVRAQTKAFLRTHPKIAKSPQAVEKIMADKRLTNDEKFTIIKTLDPNLLNLIMEQGLTGG